VLGRCDASCLANTPIRDLPEPLEHMLIDATASAAKSPPQPSTLNPRFSTLKPASDTGLLVLGRCDAFSSTNTPSRDLPESLEQMLIDISASGATTPRRPCNDDAPSSPPVAPLPSTDLRAAPPAKLATGRLQRDGKLPTFEQSPSFKLRLGFCTVRGGQTPPEDAVA